MWHAWEGAGEGQGRSSFDENRGIEVETVTGHYGEGGG